LASDGLQILFEGAQATLLDVAHGTYPFVTSSHPTVGGVYVGSGFRPRELTVLGVAKAYTTRVGAGPFPTELTDPTGALLRERGHEFGTTTGRPRRCGWLDLTVLRYSKVVNGLDLLAVTKLDVLSGLESLKVAIAYDIAGVRRDTFTVHLADLERADVVFEELPGWEDDISAARRFEQLPPAAQAYVQLIEDSVGVSVQYVGVGPEREQ
jgi:adenylosuccinate synthase